MKRKRAGGNVNRPFKKPRTTTFIPTQVISSTNVPRPPQRRLLRPPAALQVGTGKELKSCDFPIAANSPQVDVISTTATFFCVNTVQEGSSFYNRIGRRIAMQSLHLTGSIFTNQGITPGSVDEYLRIMVVYDRQPNAAAPAIADLLLDYDNQGATKTISYSHINMNNSDRFQILRDLRIAVPNDGGNLESAEAAVLDYSTNRTNVNEFIRLNNMEVHYKASTNPGAIGDISTGALWVVTFGNIAAATAAFEFKWTARLRYNDQ